MTILAFIGAAVVFLICLAALLWSVGLIEIGFDTEDEGE